MGVIFQTYLRRFCSVKEDVSKTSPRCAFSGWVISFIIYIVWFTLYVLITGVIYAAVQYGHFICTFTFMKTPCDTGETDGNWAQIRNNLWQLPSDRSEFTMTNFRSS